MIGSMHYRGVMRCMPGGTTRSPTPLCRPLQRVVYTGHVGSGPCLGLPRAQQPGSMRRNYARIVATAAAPKWPQPLEQAKVEIAARAQLAAVAARSFWEKHRKWLKTWYVKLLGVVALSLGMLTALTNIWGVNWLNEQVVPSATAAVSQQLNREVSVGRVRWAWPMGALGLGPLAAVGPVSVGPSASGLERTTAEASRVVVRVDPVQSLAQRRIIMSLRLNDTQVELVQGDNLSWFGYPDDTQPSTRATLIPGITKEQELSPDKEVQPPAAVVPPANIAGDDLDIAALTAGRRAERAAARAAKRRRAPQAGSPDGLQLNTGGPSIASVDHQKLPDPANRSSSASVARTPQPAVQTVGSQQPQQPDTLQKNGSEQITAAARGDDAANGASTNTAGEQSTHQQQIEQLPQQPLLHGLSSAGEQESHLSPLPDSLTQPQAPKEMPPGAAAQPDADGDSPAASENPADSGEQVTANRASGQDNSPAAQNAAALKIWNQMRAGLAQGRGSLLSSAPWRAVQNLPQTLPNLAPDWAPKSLLPPSSSTTTTDTPPLTAQQVLRKRMLEEISGIERVPMAADVQPDLPGGIAQPFADRSRAAASPDMSYEEPIAETSSTDQQSAGPLPVDPDCNLDAPAEGSGLPDDVSSTSERPMQSEHQQQMPQAERPSDDPARQRAELEQQQQQQSNPPERLKRSLSRDSWRDASRMRTSRIGPERFSRRTGRPGRLRSWRDQQLEEQRQKHPEHEMLPEQQQPPEQQQQQPQLRKQSSAQPQSQPKLQEQEHEQQQQQHEQYICQQHLEKETKQKDVIQQDGENEQVSSAMQHHLPPQTVAQEAEHPLLEMSAEPDSDSPQLSPVSPADVPLEVDAGAADEQASKASQAAAVKPSMPRDFAQVLKGAVVEAAPMSSAAPGRPKEAESAGEDAAASDKPQGAPMTAARRAAKLQRRYARAADSWRKAMVSTAKGAARQTTDRSTSATMPYTTSASDIPDAKGTVAASKTGMPEEPAGRQASDASGSTIQLQRQSTGHAAGPDRSAGAPVAREPQAAAESPTGAQGVAQSPAWDRSQQWLASLETAEQADFGPSTSAPARPRSAPFRLPPPPPPGAPSQRPARPKRPHDVLASRYGDMSSSGARYTPADPKDIEMLNARLGKRGKRIRKQWFDLSAWISENVKLPPVAVNTVTIRSGRVNAWVGKEVTPRRFEQTDATLQLGRDYHSLSVDLTSLVHLRDPDTHKCTMMSPTAQRHLRDAPGGQLEAAGLLSAQPSAALAGDGGTATPQQPPQRWPGDRSTIPSSMKVPPPGAAHADLMAQAQQSPLHDAGYKNEQAAAAVAEAKAAQKAQAAEAALPPTGGRVGARIRVSNMGVQGKMPELSVVITGHDLHAPMVERLIELPMDITGGRINGDLRIGAYDDKTWHFPSFGGRLRIKDGAFHFWDAVDDFSDVRMDLLFEGDRLYLHDASGKFGAVPLSMTGDMDLDPETGQYRLSAVVPGVEINALRSTLGVRPLPMPIAGALRGTLNCTGPLEEPLFSGTVAAIRPTKEMLEGVAHSHAQAAMLSEEIAVGAYDHVPVASAAGVYTFDTASEVFMLHSAKVEPAGGGQLVAGGRMWVSPRGEADGRAVRMQLQGRGLSAESLLRRYLPPGTELPAPLVLGSTSCSGTMSGSHLEPTIAGSWNAPAGQASGSIELRPTTAKVSVQAPALTAAATVHMRAPDQQAMKQALTQVEASELGRMVVEACDIDADLRGLDVLPLISPPAVPADGKAPIPAPHQRLRLAGHANFSGKALPALMGSAPDGNGAVIPSTNFAGDLKLDQLRVNQLRLCRQLSGSLEAGPSGVRLHARGLRPDEALDLDIAGAVLQRPPAATVAAPGSPRGFASGDYNVAGSQPGGPQLSGARPAAVSDAAGADSGAHLSLRCGPLLISAEANRSTSQVDCQVVGLALDELELASLRGTVQEAALHVNFDTRMGRGKLNVAGPRFSGLQGEALSGAFRWERDVLRLERVVLEQRHSRYEVQGDYAIPAGAPLPRTAASLALPPTIGGSAAGSVAASQPLENEFDPSSGRWRIQVNVPSAQMEEILPAARLLSRATAVTPLDYERAKQAFLAQVERAAVASTDLGNQIEEVVQAARAAVQADAAVSPASGGPPGSPHHGGGRSGALPGLQDVRGQWTGSWQAYGGGGGATNVDFGLKGTTWQWGDYGLDQVVAEGSYHSEEGIKLEDFSLKAGEAKLVVQGALLGAQQNASVLLTDFPMAMLQPMFRAVPALQHMAPAVGSGGPSPPGAAFLNNLTLPFLKQAGVKGPTGARKAVGYNMSSFTNSPVNGLLYLRGKLGGSAAKPEGEVSVRLYEGAIGTTRLRTADARAAIDAAQKLDFGLELAPAESRHSSGHLKVSGVVPLSELGSSATEEGKGEALDVSVDVKDSGMMIVTSLTPDLQWTGGSARLALKVAGRLDAPKVGGHLTVGKGSFTCPYLRYPVTGVAATVHVEEAGALRVEQLDARVGRRGHIKVRGHLPLQPPTRRQLQMQMNPAGGEAPKPPPSIHVDVNNLELRARNLYTGYLDASVKVERALLRPMVGGEVRVSRGAIYLFPQAPPSAPTAATGGAAGLGSTDIVAASASDASPQGQAGSPEGAKQGGLVSQAFTALSTRRGGALGQTLSRLEPQVRGTDARAGDLLLRGLTIKLGPDLRVLYPMNMLNFGIEGELALSGPAHPDHLKLAGTVLLESGEINLVAAQLQLEREHQNKITFTPEAGLDPRVDVALTGSRLRYLIKGRASQWQDHIVLTSTGSRSQTGPGAGATGEGAEALDAAEARRIFEGQLAGALLAEDGQLALSSLASNTLSTLMPKLETQGRVGQARWRVVSAPSIPGLLSLDPSADPTSLLSSLTMDSEAEIQFGRSLQAAMSRKLRDSDIATQWTLNYSLSSRLRMQFSIASSSPYPRTLIFQYSGEGSSR